MLPPVHLVGKVPDKDSKAHLLPSTWTLNLEKYIYKKKSFLLDQRQGPNGQIWPRQTPSAVSYVQRDFTYVHN